MLPQPLFYDLKPVNPGSVIYKYACATSKRKLHW